jgi:hypothetical protein
MPAWWRNPWVWRARVLLLTALLLVVIAWQPYGLIRTALPYVGLLCAIYIFWGRRRQRQRAQSG